MNKSSWARSVLVGLITVLVAMFSVAKSADEPPAKPAKASLVVGYLSVEPLTDGANPTINWQAVSIEQHTHAALLKSPYLFSAAFYNDKTLHDSKWLQSFKNPFDAMRWLEDHFHAEPVEQSRLIKVYVDGAKPDDSRMLIEKIVATYIEQQGNLELNRSLDRISALNNLRAAQQQRLHDLLERLFNMLTHLNVIGISPTGALTTPEGVEIQAMLAQRAELVAAGKPMLESLDKRIEELRKQIADQSIAAQEVLSTRDEIAKLRDRYAETQNQLDRLSKPTATSVVHFVDHPERADE